MTHKIIELSPVQTEIYLNQVQDLENPRYNVGGFIRLSAVNIERISSAHAFLIRTNDVFGTRVARSGLVHYISSQRTDSLPLIDVSTCSDPIAAAWHHVDKMFEAPFVLFDSELFQARLLKLHTNEFWYVGRAHHICMDGWSFANWAKKLSQLYNTLPEGNFARPTGDPVAPKKGKPNNARLLAQQSFWQETLENLPEPFLAGRPARRSGRLTKSLSSTQHSSVLALAAQFDSSNAHVYSALVITYLFLVYGQTDVVLAVPFHHRTTRALKELLGTFADIGILRVHIDPEMTFEDLVREVGILQRRNLMGQRLPLVQHLRQTGLHRSERPVYQVAFNYVQLEASLPIGTANGQLVYCTSYHESTPLSINICEYGVDLVPELQVDYNLGFFDSSEIALLAGRLDHLLDALSAIKNVPLRQVNAIPEQEWHRLREWQSPSLLTSDNEYCLHELFERRVREDPHAIALICGNERLTYGELNRRANRLAHRLLTYGVRPDKRVAICLGRNVEMVVGVLGVLKAGGSYVPLDPMQLDERLTFVLADCSPVLLLTERAFFSRFMLDIPILDISVLTVQGAVGELIEADLPRPQVGLTASNLAYVIYTSGSTGTPKGVLVEHRQVVRLFDSTERLFHFSNEDTWSLFHSFAFDFSVWEMWGALVHGGKLVMVPTECARSAREFYELLCAEGITVLNQTPSAFKQLQVMQEQTRREHRLRYVVFGGEALDLRGLLPWVQRNRLERTQLVNMYGITETTVHVTVHFITNDDLNQNRSLIGKPLNDLTVSVLDADLRTVPIGICGEFYIGGAGVSRGYLNRPDLTAARFLPVPSERVADARLYKTGDLGRWLPNGILEYLGRNDSQIKVRGFRIELGEIEAHLAAIPTVCEAVVVEHTDRQENRRLIAYVKPEAGAILYAAELRTELSRVLPEYMLPSAFVTVDSFPLTSNGKLDHKALPEPGTNAVASQAYEAPRGGTEAVLAAIWQQLLGLERVGRNDHFFELGGHSLLAVQVASRLRAELGVEIPLHVLFAEPVLSRLAAVAGRTAQLTLEGPLPVNRNQPLPLSLAQQRLWFLSQLDPTASAAYHMPAGLRLDGCLDRRALCSALDRIVARHEILRTTFASGAGEIIQRVGTTESGFAMQFHDLQSVPEQERVGLFTQICAEEASAPFNLETGPLVRGRLLQLGEHQHLLFFTLHHIVTDGWSIGLFINELATIYRAFSSGLADPLPPLRLQYADFASWQRRDALAASMEQHAIYWRRQLHDAPALLQLPVDRPRPPQQGYAGATARVKLDSARTDMLLRLGQRHGTTLFMTLLASWAVLLTRLSGQDDVVIGTPMANRRSVEAEELIGPFVNMLPLRVWFADGPTVSQLLAQVKKTCLSAHEHQDFPFERIIDAVGADRHPSYSPLFQSALILDNTPTRKLELPGLTLSPWEPVYVGAKHDLSLHVVEENGSIDCTIVYNTSLFDSNTIQAFVRHWSQILSAMCGNDNASVSTLGADDIEELEVASLPDHPIIPSPLFIPFAPHEINQTIGERFIAQVQQHWNDTAIMSMTRNLSYGEVYMMAQRVEQSIVIAQAVEAPVGLLLSHGEEMIVGILGTLLAGRCYVPLDPEYPQSRLAFMVRDSGMTHIIASTTHLTLGRHIAGTSLQVVTMDQTPLLDSKAYPPAMRRSLGVPDDIAYILYTSGSTGQPKGIVQNHRNVLYFCSCYTNNLAISASDRVALVASFSFDAAVMDLFGALLNGACLVPIHPKALDAEGLRGHLSNKEVSIYHSTPTLFRHLFAAEASVRLPKVRAVVLGGELASRTDLDIYLKAFSDTCVFVNGYGPTESTLALQRFLDKPKARLNGPITVGYPVAGTTVRIGDPNTPLTAFKTGEIYIRSGHLAVQYHGRQELTSTAFGTSSDGTRYYRSGDIGRVLADGSVQILGRADNQIKLRGIRIEPGEIEFQLKRCHGVQDAIVVLREDQPGDQRLVAYIIADERWEQSDVLANLTQTLPSQMIPSCFLQLKQLPLTPSGKVDRRALPEPPVACSASFTPPITGTEIALVRIWSDCVGRTAIGVTDNFFGIGGNSLVLIQVYFRINQEFNLNLSLSSVMKLQTIEILARTIDELLVQRAAHNRIMESAPQKTGIRI
ncbi:non-ribosomal peptide synthetase [Massilia aurea]|uniref:non-ribosomal peptide synthetase n=1 Tax=Massilia aurea TaxID=373040 RepID=UPI002162F51E|nr:non-ribosomal peptide synthetase [Massilia aurea]MCS0709959.1 amino acid adenylation domain-containing protein [Massilia aurea]